MIVERVKTIIQRIRKRLFPARHLRFGAKGEHIAKTILERSGMEYLTRNFRCNGGEIDLIFREGGLLCFIEVKTRHRSLFAPERAVTREKKTRITKAALRYIRLCGLKGIETRCDIVEVIFDGDKLSEVHHYRDAFQLVFRH